MSLRVRLAVAFLLLSALPLGGFAVWSYWTSRAALDRAARAQAELAAEALGARVGNASRDLGDRLRRLAALPPESWARIEPSDTPQLDETIEGVAPAFAFLEDLRFEPTPPSAAAGDEGGAPRPAPVARAAPELVVRVGELDFDVAPSPAPKREMPAEQRAFALREIRRVREEVARALEAQQGESDALRAEQRLALRSLERTERQLEQTERQLEQVDRRRESAPVPPVPTVAPPAPAAPPVEPAPPSPAERPAKAPAAPVAPLAAGGFVFQIADRDGVVGTLRAKVKAKELLGSVLAQTDRERGEVPFALDAEDRLYVATPEDRDRIESLPELAAIREGRGPVASTGDWVITVERDPATGFRFGIARPLGAAIAELKAATARNFALGFGLIGVATVLFFPLTRRIVADVRELEEVASRIAAGDLDARVTVRGGDELGRLGAAFNRMAGQIADHQEQILAEERRRKEDEITRRLLEAENERRGRELEEAREFQLSLLPRELPRLAGLDLAVEMTTATEVGGDYYDFQDASDGTLVFAIGDATGHGAAAGTLVTAVKSLFAAAIDSPPAAFLVAANAAIHRMALVRRAMALAVGRVDGDRLVVSSAGMPPILHYRAAEGRAEEIVLPGTPLGARAEFPYAEAGIVLAPGDALLFLSDGLPELPNADGEPFGYERLRAAFAGLARGTAAEVVAGLRAAAEAWSGGRPPVDDSTLLVFRRETGGSYRSR